MDVFEQLNYLYASAEERIKELPRRDLVFEVSHTFFTKCQDYMNSQGLIGSLPDSWTHFRGIELMPVSESDTPILKTRKKVDIWLQDVLAEYK